MYFVVDEYTSRVYTPSMLNATTRHPARETSETTHITETATRACCRSCWDAVCPVEECVCACGGKNHSKGFGERFSFRHGVKHRLVAVGLDTQVLCRKIDRRIAAKLAGTPFNDIEVRATPEQIRTWPELAGLGSRGLWLLWEVVTESAQIARAA